VRYTNNIEKLIQEGNQAGRRILNLENQIIGLQQESGRILLEHGSGSSQFAEIKKRIKQIDDDLEDARITNIAISNAIKQAKHEQRKKESAEILKRNQQILHDYEKPKCPRSGLAEHVKLQVVRPDLSQATCAVDTPHIYQIDYLCIGCGTGHIFSLFFGPDGKLLPAGIRKPPF